MTIEQSHGKARPSLTRSSDLRLVPTERERDEWRDAGGRVVHGNGLARGRGWKSAIKRGLPRTTGSTELDQLSAESWTLYCALLREVPYDGPSVRALAAQVARATALATYYANRAAEAGLDTSDGMAFDERAMKHGQRAERVSVTMLDVASKFTKKPEPADYDPLAPWRKK